ncbi:hypothetical protein PFISCL1PPCAC_11951, partial [Pristionchus fissidentatus]
PSFTMFILFSVVLLFSYIGAEAYDEGETEPTDADWCLSSKMENFEYCPAAAAHNGELMRKTFAACGYMNPVCAFEESMFK